MGIYTDYGRFMKAREFKNWCNNGAGIWFGFGTGSPRWDYEVLVNSSSSKPNVPTSSPAAYTPLYKWYAQYKDPSWEGGSQILQDPETVFLDGSAIIETEEEPDPMPTAKTSTELYNEWDTFPSNGLSPAICKLGPGSLTPPHITFSDVSFYMWEKEYADPDSGTSSELYPSPSIPPFPVSYLSDWNTYHNPMSAYNSSPSIPSDPELYKQYAYDLHFFQVMNTTVPLGFLSLIQGKALFVEPIDDTEVQDSLKTFKYGKHYWRIVPDTDITAYKLPHHILLTVSVFPNELINDTIAERYLLVRQVSVFKFPDYLKTELGLDSVSVPRANQVIRADRLNMLYPGATPVSGKANIPFNCNNPLEPNPLNPNGDETVEMLVNDFMTGRKRDVQQTDRYGYIIGF